MKEIRHFVGAMVVVALLLAVGFSLYAVVRDRPQDMPWAALDLGEKPGIFTGRKLAGLTQDYAACTRLLDKAGVKFTRLKPVSSGQSCGYADGVRLDSGGARRVRFAPRDLGMACPVAAASVMWEWNVLQDAARRHFDGARVTEIEHFGSYNCRRMYGRGAGDWSEHATADAVDVSGFRLSNGTRITVARDWTGDGPKAAFLREVRDGACKLFATVLSPDYNRAHHDHLHLDQAERGEMGWRACR